MSNQHPFFAGRYRLAGKWIDTQDFDVSSRLRRVQTFSLAQCRRALSLPGLQKTVRTAVERRIRKLEKEQ